MWCASQVGIEDSGVSAQQKWYNHNYRNWKANHNLQKQPEIRGGPTPILTDNFVSTRTFHGENDLKCITKRGLALYREESRIPTKSLKSRILHISPGVVAVLWSNNKTKGDKDSIKPTLKKDNLHSLICRRSYMDFLVWDPIHIDHSSWKVPKFSFQARDTLKIWKRPYNMHVSVRRVKVYSKTSARLEQLS